MKLKMKIKKKTRWKFNQSEKHWEIDQNSIHAPYERLLFYATFVCSLALTVWYLFSHSLENLPHRHSTGCSNSINRSKRQAIEKKNLSLRIFFCNDVHSHTLRWRESEKLSSTDTFCGVLCELDSYYSEQTASYGWINLDGVILHGWSFWGFSLLKLLATFRKNCIRKNHAVVCFGSQVFFCSLLFLISYRCLFFCISFYFVFGETIFIKADLSASIPFSASVVFL